MNNFSVQLRLKDAFGNAELDVTTDEPITREELCHSPQFMRNHPGAYMWVDQVDPLPDGKATKFRVFIHYHRIGQVNKVHSTDATIPYRDISLNEGVQLSYRIKNKNQILDVVDANYYYVQMICQGRNRLYFNDQLTKSFHSYLLGLHKEPMHFQKGIWEKKFFCFLN